MGEKEEKEDGGGAELDGGRPTPTTKSSSSTPRPLPTSSMPAAPIRPPPDLLRSKRRRRVPLVDRFEMDPWQRWRRYGAFPRTLLLHVILVIVATSQALLLVQTTSAFSSNIHWSLVTWLLPSEYLATLTGSELSYPGDQIFLHRTDQFNETLFSIFTNYFALVDPAISGGDAGIDGPLGVVEMVEVYSAGTASPLRPPSLSFSLSYGGEYQASVASRRNSISSVSSSNSSGGDAHNNNLHDAQPLEETVVFQNVGDFYAWTKRAISTEADVSAFSHSLLRLDADLQFRIFNLAAVGYTAGTCTTWDVDVTFDLSARGVLALSLEEDFDTCVEGWEEAALSAGDGRGGGGLRVSPLLVTSALLLIAASIQLLSTIRECTRTVRLMRWAADLGEASRHSARRAAHAKASKAMRAAIASGRDATQAISRASATRKVPRARVGLVWLLRAMFCCGDAAAQVEEDILDDDEAATERSERKSLSSSFSLSFAFSRSQSSQQHQFTANTPRGGETAAAVVPLPMSAGGSRTEEFGALPGSPLSSVAESRRSENGGAQTSSLRFPLPLPASGSRASSTGPSPFPTLGTPYSTAGSSIYSPVPFGSPSLAPQPPMPWSPDGEGEWEREDEGFLPASPQLGARAHRRIYSQAQAAVLARIGMSPSAHATPAFLVPPLALPRSRGATSSLLPENTAADPYYLTQEQYSARRAEAAIARQKRLIGGFRSSSSIFGSPGIGSGSALLLLSREDRARREMKSAALRVTHADIRELFSPWLVIVLLGECLNIVYACYCLVIGEVAIPDNIDALFALGAALEWASLSRYLRYHETFSIFERAFAKALPSVVANLVATVPVFLAFGLFSTMIFGDLTERFDGLLLSSISLFAVANGDVVRETFLVSLQYQQGTAMRFLSQLVMYAYCVTFIYLMLKTTTAIIEEAFLATRPPPIGFRAEGEGEGEGEEKGVAAQGDASSAMSPGGGMFVPPPSTAAAAVLLPPRMPSGRYSLSLHLRNLLLAMQELRDAGGSVAGAVQDVVSSLPSHARHHDAPDPLSAVRASRGESEGVGVGERGRVREDDDPCPSIRPQSLFSDSLAVLSWAVRQGVKLVLGITKDADKDVFGPVVSAAGGDSVGVVGEEERKEEGKAESRKEAVAAGTGLPGWKDGTPNALPSIFSPMRRRPSAEPLLGSAKIGPLVGRGGGGS